MLNKARKLRAYMAYDRHAGRQETAVLVIDRTVQEARKAAYPYLTGFFLCGDGFIDTAANWVRSDHIFALANQDKSAAGEPHVVDSPEVCASCELWGWGVQEDGSCCGCGEPAGERLVKLYQDYWARQETAVAKEISE